MLFFGRKKRLIDHASGSRAGKAPAAVAQALGDAHGPLPGDAHLPLGGPVQETLVFRLADGSALVQTADFLSPQVNDPTVFGGIAAAHVLGPIYAIGGVPQFAYQWLGYPDDGAAWLAEIVCGGTERMQAAQVRVGGWQAVRDSEIKLGYAVTGWIDPSRIVGLAGARPGDQLVLTKALGTGMVTAAHKADACPEDVLLAACAGMLQFNDIGRDAMQEVGAHAAGVVNRVGLAGLAVDMAECSKVTLIVEVAQLPVLAGAQKLARKSYITRGASANAAAAAPWVRKEGKLDAGSLEFCHDPETSGGLLISVPAAEAEMLVQKCRGRGALATNIIGAVVERQEQPVVLRG